MNDGWAWTAGVHDLSARRLEAEIEAFRRLAEELIMFPVPERGRRWWTLHFWHWSSASYRDRLMRDRETAVNSWRASEQMQFNGLAGRYKECQ